MKRLFAISLVLVGCGSGSDSDNAGPEPIGFEAPVVTNPQPPVEYPLALYEEGVEGTVLLRLFLDEQGNVVTDSTGIEESSGHPALDSAALAGVERMEFAPARQDGQPIAALFLQPIQFRRSDVSDTGNSP